MPFISKNEYKIFTFGKTYTIKEECIGNIKNIDSYREFIWSKRPTVWIPILIISAIISGVISFFVFHDFTYLKVITVWISILIYSVLSIVLYAKIRKSINCI